MRLVLRWRRARAAVEKGVWRRCRRSCEAACVVVVVAIVGLVIGRRRTARLAKSVRGFIAFGSVLFSLEALICLWVTFQLLRQLSSIIVPRKSAASRARRCEHLFFSSVCRKVACAQRR